LLRFMSWPRHLALAIWNWFDQLVENDSMNSAPGSHWRSYSCEDTSFQTGPHP
jgi:hypothetical protein